MSTNDPMAEVESLRRFFAAQLVAVRNGAIDRLPLAERRQRYAAICDGALKLADLAVAAGRRLAEIEAGAVKPLDDVL